MAGQRLLLNGVAHACTHVPARGLRRRKCCLHIGLGEQGVEEADGAAAGAGGEPGGICVEAVTPVGTDCPLPTPLQHSDWLPSHLERGVACKLKTVIQQIRQVYTRSQQQSQHNNVRA